MTTLDDLIIRHRAAVQTKDRLNREAKEAWKQAEVAGAAKQVITQAAAACQQAAYEGVAACVTRCMAAVFGEAAYRCELEVTTGRGRPQCRLRFFDPDGLEIDLMTAGAGGEVDVAAFALRVAAVAIARPPVRRLLVLDEPFRHLSRDKADNARELILSLAKELDIQFLFSTHSPDLACGRIVQF